MPRSPWLAAPNLITLGRFALVPVFLVLHAQGRPGWALTAFAVASLSDGLDGLLARLLDQRTKLGALLDPMADKVLVLAALLALWVEHRAPGWLVALIFISDGYMALLAWVVHARRLEVTVQPTRVGKYAMAAVLVFVVLSLVDELRGGGADLHVYAQVFGIIAGLAIFLSTVQYFFRFGHLLFGRRAAS